MNLKLKNNLSRVPFHILLLPVFFVLHGFTENYNFIPAKDALLLAIFYILVACALTAVSWLLFKNLTKAALITFLLLAIQFFFGSVHDFLKRNFPESFLTRYTFIVPLILVSLLAGCIFLKRNKTGLTNTTFFLNSLFILFLLGDSVWLLSKSASAKKIAQLSPGFISCKECPKPDVYFIIADEYAGNKEFKELFGYDDSSFLRGLSDRKFQTVTKSHSNYNYTPFSVASMLNVNYLNLDGRTRGKSAITYCYEKIHSNDLVRFFRSEGYEFYNYSVFDVEGHPALIKETFLPVKTQLITSQTFLSRLNKDLRFNLVTRWKSKRELLKLTYGARDNNRVLMDATKNLPARKHTRPRFVYTHLMMPHYPYYFDRNGKEQPFETLLEGQQINKSAYIEYVQYTGKQLLSMIDQILQASVQPPLIILWGDHGFRHFTAPVKPEYHFMNLAAVYSPLPGYKPLHDSVGAINLMRNILNTHFGQQFPYLTDSTIYLDD